MAGEVEGLCHLADRLIHFIDLKDKEIVCGEAIAKERRLENGEDNS